VTIYTTLYGGVGSPVQATITGSSNGNPTSQTETLGATVYDNVSGVCNPNDPSGACPHLVYHNLDICAVDNHWTSVSYNSTVSTEYTTSSCTGVTRHFDVISSYSVNAAGALLVSQEKKGTANMTCNNGGRINTNKGSDDELDTISLNLANGAGSANIASNTHYVTTDNGNPLGNSTTNANYAGSVSWPIEATQPPQFGLTGLFVSSSAVAAGQALPQACTVGAP
jgi:hypothetical protein